MDKLLIIVSRSQPTLYPYLNYVFGRETADVILDRRVGERRRPRERAATERRRRDRRQRDITRDLQTFGWALVRRLYVEAEEHPGSEGSGKRR